MFVPSICCNISLQFHVCWVSVQSFEDCSYALTVFSVSLNCFTWSSDPMTLLVACNVVIWINWICGLGVGITWLRGHSYDPAGVLYCCEIFTTWCQHAKSGSASALKQCESPGSVMGCTLSQACWQQVMSHMHFIHQLMHFYIQY